MAQLIWAAEGENSGLATWQSQIIQSTTSLLRFAGRWKINPSSCSACAATTGIGLVRALNQDKRTPLHLAAASKESTRHADSQKLSVNGVKERESEVGKYAFSSFGLVAPCFATCHDGWTTPESVLRNSW